MEERKLNDSAPDNRANEGELKYVPRITPKRIAIHQRREEEKKQKALEPKKPIEYNITKENAKSMGKAGGKGRSGSVNLNTAIREIGSNLDWNKTLLKDTQKEQYQDLYGKNGWKALIYVAFSKAMEGDMKAFNWLSENGFGKHLKLEVDGGLFAKKEVRINVVSSKYDDIPNISDDGQLETAIEGELIDD